ncbi:MAG: M23 family metallopeptidase [Candidatus Andersenbacteria bacterium]
MRTKLPLLLLAFLFFALTASASLAGVWQFPLDQSWIIDPEFQFGSPYGGEVHLGEDVEAPAGTPVHAAANGTVVLTANFPGYHDWGGLILIAHKNVTGSAVVSLYGHIDARSFAVRPGQMVNRGQTIGRVGDSNHNGHWKTHLHFAVRKGGFVSSPWVYWGFASRATLGKWEAAHLYVPAHAGLKDVARVPINGRNRYETAAAGKNPAAVVDDKLQASEDAGDPGQRYVIDPVQADYLYIVRINEYWWHWDNEHTLRMWIQHSEYPTVLSEGLAELSKTHVIEAIEPTSILVDNTTYGYVVRVHPIEQH